jgi:2-succinyl-6-hydroxy-2,4-cyclohexadiene-1-carboxylate synthase
MSRPRFRLVALHGFLGSPSDWEALAGWFPRAVVTPIDLWALLDGPGVVDWATMSDALERAVAGAGPAGDDLPAFLVAYSFGARLALGCDALASPDGPVRGSCLISCNPGLPDDDGEGRRARRASDERWARRLLEAPEGEIWREWDAQPVLAGGSAPPRRGLPASREALARALGRFSLAGQPDRRDRVRGWQTPLLWVSGANDARFVAMADAVAASGAPATFFTCEGAGHRVPWDNPAGFSRAVSDWIGEVLGSDEKRERVEQV